MRSSYTSIAAAAALALTTPAAFAGGVAPAVVEPAPVAVAAPAPVVDWSGFYAGLSYGRVDGRYKNAGTWNDFEGGGAPGVFLGFNMQNGNFVYGGELGYSAPDKVKVSGDTAKGLRDLVDLSARVGYSAQRALIYAKVGYSTADYRVDGAGLGGPGSASFDGVSYGVGVDFQITNNIFAGLEYVNRNLNGKIGGVKHDIDASSVGVRVGYRF